MFDFEPEEIRRQLSLTTSFHHVAWKKNEINGVVDGIVYGGLAGLGFAFAENTMYFAEALAVSVGDFAVTVGIRAGLSAFAHPLFTALTGIGFAVAAEGGRYRYLWPFAGLMGAMGLHALWNSSAMLGVAWYIGYAVFFVPVVTGVSIAGWMAARREAGLIRTHLARDVRLGLLTQAEVEEVASLARRRAAARHFEQHLGRPGRDARAAFHRAATRLALLRNRAATGAPDAQEESRLVHAIAQHKRELDPQWVPPSGVQV